MLKEESIQLFDTYMSYVAVLTLPGVAAMDYAFGRGLFSGGIGNIYEFFLLIFWSISLSVPFLVLVVAVLHPHLLHDKGDPYGKSMTSTINASLLYVFTLVLANYALFNACDYYFSDYLRRLVISDVRVSLFIVSGIATFVLAYPLAWMYRQWLPTLRFR